jgi:hypothetical protein
MVRLFSVVRPGSPGFEVALALTFILLFVVPTADQAASPIILKARHAQDLLNELRGTLLIPEPVFIDLVLRNPLVFSVEPEDRQRNRFELSMDVSFLQILNDTELRAALAHELGHVWIFKHHPFLQTERLANEVGQRAVPRSDLEQMYTKLWSYENRPGVPFEGLLGTTGDEPPSDGP